MLDDPTPAADAAAQRLRLQPEALQVLRALDPSGGSAFLQRVLETYLASLDKQLAAQALALQADDCRAFVLSVHSLKSASASVGAAELSQTCAALEARLRDEQATSPAWRALRAGGEPAALRALALRARAAVEAELREVRS